MILPPLNASALPILLTGMEINVFLVISQNIGKPLIKDVWNVLLNNIGADNFKFAQNVKQDMPMMASSRNVLKFVMEDNFITFSLIIVNVLLLPLTGMALIVSHVVQGIGAHL